VTTDASVSIHEVGSDVALGGWADGYCPREGEVIELPGAQRYVVRTVLHRLTRAPGSLHSVVTAFVRVAPIYPVEDRTRPPASQTSLPTGEEDPK
jgi:hypothetical protein